MSRTTQHRSIDAGWSKTVEDKARARLEAAEQAGRSGASATSGPVSSGCKAPSQRARERTRDMPRTAQLDYAEQHLPFSFSSVRRFGVYLHAVDLAGLCRAMARAPVVRWRTRGYMTFAVELLNNTRNDPAATSCALPAQKH